MIIYMLYMPLYILSEIQLLPMPPLNKFITHFTICFHHPWYMLYVVGATIRYISLHRRYGAVHQFAVRYSSCSKAVLSALTSNASYKTVITTLILLTVHACGLWDSIKVHVYGLGVKTNTLLAIAWASILTFLIF